MGIVSPAIGNKERGEKDCGWESCSTALSYQRGLTEMVAVLDSPPKFFVPCTGLQRD